MSKTRQNITAVIYDKRGRVLSIGKNQYLKTHPLQAKYACMVGQSEKVFLHAEIHAIVRCRKLHKAYKILVSRWDKNGKALLAKPCLICQSAIKAAGIKYVEHT
jgi:tRNA(Arg) A34 adenosine deaminase TadA